MSSWNLAWNITLVRLSWAVLQPVYDREAESCAECGQEQLNCNKPSHNIPILGSFAIGDFLGIFCSWKYFSKYIFKVLGVCKKAFFDVCQIQNKLPAALHWAKRRKDQPKSMYQKRELQIAEVLQYRVGLYTEQALFCACLPLPTSLEAKPSLTTMSACADDGVSPSCHHLSFQVFSVEN